MKRAAWVSCVPHSPHRTPPHASKLTRCGPTVFLGLGGLCHALLASLADFWAQPLSYSYRNEILQLSYEEAAYLCFINCADSLCWPYGYSSFRAWLKLWNQTQVCKKPNQPKQNPRNLLTRNANTSAKQQTFKSVSFHFHFPPECSWSTAHRLLQIPVII